MSANQGVGQVVGRARGSESLVHSVGAPIELRSDRCENFLYEIESLVHSVGAPIELRSDRCENFLYEIKAARLRRAARAARPGAGPQARRQRLHLRPGAGGVSPAGQRDGI